MMKKTIEMLLAATIVAMQIHVSHQEDIAVEPVIGNDPIPPMSEYVPSDPKYPKDFRILDCWQCFQAQGKMCKDKDHASLMDHI